MPDARDRTPHPVVSDDPALSADSNRRLTEELQGVVGRDTAPVAGDALFHHDPRANTLVALLENRLLIVFAALTLLVVGAAITVTTGSAIAVILAVGVGVGSLLAAVAATFRLTNDVERPSPDLAAQLQDEGVANPDRLMTDLVQEFSEPDPARGRSRDADVD